MSNLAEGVIEDVYFGKGVNTISGEPKFQKAPFQLISFKTADGPSELFVMPSTLVNEIDQAFASDNPGEQEEMALHDFGYFSLKFHVVDESVLGDYVGNPNTWRGFHSFDRY